MTNTNCFHPASSVDERDVVISHLMLSAAWPQAWCRLTGCGGQSGCPRPGIPTRAAETLRVYSLRISPLDRYSASECLVCLCYL